MESAARAAGLAGGALAHLDVLAAAHIPDMHALVAATHCQVAPIIAHSSSQERVAAGLAGALFHPLWRASIGCVLDGVVCSLHVKPHPAKTHDGPTLYYFPSWDSSHGMVAPVGVLLSSCLQAAVA